MSKEIAQGEGCSPRAGGFGTFTYTYTSTERGRLQQLGDENGRRAARRQPETVYTNAYGEVMLSVYTDATSGLQWDTFYEYNSAGQVILQADPSAVTGYNDAYADLLHNVSGNYQYLNNTSGLITLTDFYASTTATETTAGGVSGYQEDVKLEQGQKGTPILQESWQYFTHTAGGATVNPVATDTVYRNTDGTGGEDDELRLHLVLRHDADAVGDRQRSRRLVGAKWAGHGRRDDGGVRRLRPHCLDEGRRRLHHLHGLRPGHRGGCEDHRRREHGGHGRLRQPADGLDDADGRRPGTHHAIRRGRAEVGRRRRFRRPATSLISSISMRITRCASTRAGTPRRERRPAPPRSCATTKPTATSESFTMSAAPHLTGGVPDGTEAISGLQTLARRRERSWAGYYIGFLL